jgi:hypothetical protein
MVNVTLIMRTYLIIALFVMISACVDRQKQWLNNYAVTKCAYQVERAKFTSDSLQAVTPLLARKARLERQLANLKTPYLNHIGQLRSKIKVAEESYLTAYREAQDRQNAKVGHVSSPEYEKIHPDTLSRLFSRKKLRFAIALIYIRNPIYPKES